MNNDAELVLQKGKLRYEVLMELWRASEGNHNTSVNFFTIAKGLGLSSEASQDVYLYFKDEGFFEHQRPGGWTDLSHRAIVEIESTLTNPQHSTDHFSTTVIQHFHAPVGAVQTGNDSFVQVNQNNGLDVVEILKHLDALREQFQSLPVVEERNEAFDVIEALTIEIKSEAPSKERIRSFLLATKEFAVKTGTELAATTLAKLIESQMGVKF